MDVGDDVGFAHAPREYGHNVAACSGQLEEDPPFGDGGDGWEVAPMAERRIEQGNESHVVIVVVEYFDEKKR